MLRPETIRRRNNESFPLLVDMSEHLKEGCQHIDVMALEKLLNEFFECELTNMPFDVGIKQLDICRNFIKNYSNEYPDDELFLDLSRKFFGENLVPSSMLYKDIYEMQKNISLMYQLSYAHYILGKHNKMEYDFPCYCCGRSSRNLLTAFWEAGIVSAIVVNNEDYDHSYIIVPFVNEKQNIRGVILVDPTSDQLIKQPHKKIKNKVQVIAKKYWSYETDWANGKNLYPTRILISACYGYESKDYESYIEMALNNPVVVV